MKDFTAGVVEGFYGVPWTGDQRRILFTWMQQMGLNTYMYAPKDDHKHRAYWRDLYSVEEADNLTCLIESAHEKGVTFVYAISPGLDIAFSSAKDVQTLKRKLEQVSAFGCRAFAILFDDIDPELSEADQSMFSSSACAQASLTNEVYEHLSQPKFYFCPTEYCATRAQPSILSSEYLTTLGSKLLPGIDIMWTGCKVISKKITIQTLEDITTVLKRPPVIWDNIHANDYDPRRVFLGPYDGRSPEIIPYIRGVMTNPNCEFEANYIACHTLGQWSKSNPDGVKKDIIANERLSPIAADIKLETEVDIGSDEDLPTKDEGYKPRQALKVALADWHAEFLIARHPHRRLLPPPRHFGGPPGVPPPGLPSLPSPSQPPIPTAIPMVSMPIPDMMKTCTTTTPTVITPTTSIQGTAMCMSMPFATPTPPPLAALAGPCTTLPNPSLLQPLTEPVNALAEDCISTDLDGLSDSGTEVEAMECVPSTSASLPVGGSSSSSQKNGSSESLMQVEGCDNGDKVDTLGGTSSPAPLTNGEKGHIVGAEPPPGSGPVTMDDLVLLTDLFYMPFEHGPRAVQFLQTLHWLIDHVHAVLPAKKDTDEYKEWQKKAGEFEACVQDSDVLLQHLFYSPNKSLLCCMHTYIWDLKSTLSVCLAFVKWLEHGLVTDASSLPNNKMATWFSEGYKEAFTGGEMEPWAFRGGLQSELQRFLPVAPAHDLFFIKPPEIIVPVLPRFRPYQPEDKEQVYDICLKTCDDGMDGTDVFPENPKLIGDRLVGRFLALSPEFCFVVEDQHGVCGYVLAARDACTLTRKTRDSWTPSMCEKYPKPLQDDISPAEEVMLSFHSDPVDPGEEVYGRYPSILRLDMLASRLADPAVPRRLLACALCALKAAGSCGVHTELNAGDEFMSDIYAKLGFITVVSESDKSSDDMIYMGRLF